MPVFVCTGRSRGDTPPEIGMSENPGDSDDEFGVGDGQPGAEVSTHTDQFATLWWNGSWQV